MRKVDDGKRKEEKNGVFSGDYVIASSLPPERRPLERHTLVATINNILFFFSVGQRSGELIHLIYSRPNSVDQEIKFTKANIVNWLADKSFAQLCPAPACS